MVKIGRPIEYSDEVALEVLRSVRDGISYRACAVKYGISLSMVQRIVKGAR